MRPKVLLVDDEEGIRKVLSIALVDLGYDVVTASDGDEALSQFRKVVPSIVLTDIKMPGMDGIEVLKKIKDENPDTEVIMITGHGDMELAIQSLKYEATDFITKPINTDALEIALMRANEKIELKARLREYTENLEQLVAEKTEELIQAERLAAVGQTVAGLAHAIKNITGGLTGGAFVLEKGIELDNKKYLSQGWEMVKNNTERIKHMALDLLNYAKDREPNYQLCDPNRILREVAELMLPRAEEYGIRLVLETDDTLPEVWLDAEQIHRCLLNLVTNAIDACAEMGPEQGPGEVVLQSARNGGDVIEYQINDNGCGMDAETHAKVFHRFFSTKGSRGTGLGLMISKKIIDEHDGSIELQSEQGQGTRFTVRLPGKRPADKDPENG